jgi:hypothetical protein
VRAHAENPNSAVDRPLQDWRKEIATAAEKEDRIGDEIRRPRK